MPAPTSSRYRSLLTTDVGAAAAALAAGSLVALPTETVYGLGADASSADAVARIYRAKGRPADHPVIVHLSTSAVSDPQALAHWARQVPAYARDLADAFWPGPLTLLLPRALGVGDHVTGGLDSVGLRCPAHPVAQALLTAFGGGVAAPSANRFGRVSPTTADHVLSELGDRLVPGRDLVLDGGPCLVGVESTIVDCTGGTPRLLRPGGVTVAELRSVAPLLLTGGSGPAGVDGTEVRAPGMLPSHYAPRARVVLVEPGAAVVAAGTTGLIALASVPTPETGTWVRLAAPSDPGDYARALYGALRAADELGLEALVAVLPPDEGVGHAIRDRLRRAAHPSAR